MKRSSKADLSYRTAAGRWARLGPYYAMFPIPFVEDVVQLYAEPGQMVIDPFCGRGTVPFIAMVNGRNAAGCDVNPVAWLYAKTKTAPHPELTEVVNRIEHLASLVNAEDRIPTNEFQKFAFCEDVLGFINAGRRELQWRTDSADRTVATLLIQHLHDKKGHGLSNQMRHSRALSPQYCINWWTRNGMAIPPEVDAMSFMKKRAAWRYAKGTPVSGKNTAPAIELGDSATSLPSTGEPANLVLTSPPYSNVTNYRADNWLRLWALGAGPDLPDWDPEQKFAAPKAYEQMLTACLTATKARTCQDTVWYIRSDARAKTKNIISSVMRELLPDHRAYENPAPYRGQTQTALYGDLEKKPGEVDLLYLPRRKKRRGFTKSFNPSKR